MGRWSAVVAAGVALVVVGSVPGTTSTRSTGERAESIRTLSTNARAASAFSDTYFDAGFVPVAPCRIVDTRSAGGALTANQIRDYVVTGQDGFAEQGGADGGCGIPLGVTVAVHMNLTAVDPTGKGYMRAWPYDDPQPPVPNATVLNYSSALNASNGVTVEICNEFMGGQCDSDLLVKNFAATTHLVVDVLGYYLPPSVATVAADGSVDLGARVVTASKTATGVYSVEFFDVVGLCAVSASLRDASTGGEISVEEDVSDPEGATLTVRTFDSAGAPADEGFHVKLTC